MTVSAFRVFALFLAISAVPPGICAAQGLPATAGDRFEALDVNQDGVLSKYEYDSDAAFAVMDNDGNGRISAAELQSILGSGKDDAALAASRIRLADLDKDGELSDEELRRGLEFRFEWLDSNKDGNLDLAELESSLGVPTVMK